MIAHMTLAGWIYFYTVVCFFIAFFAYGWYTHRRHDRNNRDED